PAIRLEVISLETTQADRLAPRIQSLMRQRQQALGREAMPSDRVSIEPDTASNSLIVAASEENLQIIHDLVDALVRAESGVIGEAEIELIQLISSRADDLVDLLDDLYVNEANRDRGRDTVRVTADERLNAVVINAPAADVRAIKQLVARLDGARPATVVEIKYIPLGARRSPVQAIVLKYLREAAERMDDESGEMLTEMEVSSAIRESISLTPDLRTNSVIVSAPRQAMGLIEQMIRDMDESTSGSKNIRIFELKNADALAMAEILTDLFNLTQQGNLYVLKPRETLQREPGIPGAELPPGVAPYAGLLGTELTAVPDERQQLFITVDSRTNSLLVSGTPIYLDLVSEVVDQLDALEANEREVLVYPLRNAVATDVASVITSFVEAEQQKLVSTLSPDQIGAAARLLEREVTIVGDEKSNTVLVSASPRYLDRVREMINELDVDPPQVLIQVLLAEITIDTGLEWGFDTRFEAGPYGGDNLFLRGASSLASAFLPTLGIPSFSVSTDDFTLMLRALESQGRLQVLSNPSVMAANNESARTSAGPRGRPSPAAGTSRRRWCSTTSA
ncbi:MAG: secretin N-terminal domain-containing protein, partial [Planctomycetota bacterium]